VLRIDWRGHPGVRVVRGMDTIVQERDDMMARTAAVEVDR
jgi:hypothetical protein